MRWLKRIGLGLASLVALVAVACFAAIQLAKRDWLKPASYEGHDLPIPFPLTEDEIAALRAERAAPAAAATPAGTPATPDAVTDGAGAAATPPDPLAGVDLQAIALERARERGKHLVESRVGCTDCHGADLGGNVVMDVPPVGRFACPNITTGKGSRIEGFTAKDWDRILRHGYTKAGHRAIMPSLDFVSLSDREVSDVVAYVRSFPPVDRVPPDSKYGPVLAFSALAGEMPFSADLIDHAKPHAQEPPPAQVDVTFGRHVGQVCVGCHGEGLSGGPIPGGDPSWPPAANITPHETGLKGWTIEDFRRALREGRSKDGREIDPKAMPWKMTALATDTEIDALWAWLQTVPPKPLGQR